MNNIYKDGNISTKRNSSYFPTESEEYSSIMEAHNGSRNKFEQKLDLFPEHKNNVNRPSSNIIEFPLNKQVLWNRTVVSSPNFMNAQDIIPSIYLSDLEIRIILSNLLAQEKGEKNLEISVETLKFSDLKSLNSSIYDRPSFGIFGAKPKYIFKMTNFSYNYLSNCLNKNENVVDSTLNKVNDSGQYLKIPIVSRAVVGDDIDSLLFDIPNTL